MADTIQEILADIAILDDDLDFRNYLEDFLKDEALYTIRAFARPQDLFDGCEERLPEIVLLDMKMGDANGDHVLEQLITRWPGLCVIIITGYPSLEGMRATFKLKVFDYLATHTRLSVSQISAIERGANLPSIESFLAISKAFDKKPSEILASIEF